MDPIRIFIASSSELEADRDAFRLYLSEQNDRLQPNGGTYLKLEQWEHFLDTISHSSKQSDYNQKIKECDIVICLFHTKAGKYTVEEFDTALKHFKDTKRPLIYTYFKTTPTETEPEEDRKKSLKNFKARLNKLGHFYTLYNNIDQLKNKFRTQLDLLEEKGYIQLQEDVKQETEKAIENYFHKEITIGDIETTGTVIIGDVTIHTDQTPEEPPSHKRNKREKPPKPSKVDSILSLIYSYGVVLMFLSSIYLFIHNLAQMIIDKSYMENFMADYKYIPFIVSFTGFSAAMFFRILSKLHTVEIKN